MEEKVFDHDGVMERLDGDEDLLKELVGVFEEEWPRLISVIKGHLEASEESGVALHAHSLKGALGNVGAVRAALAAKALEFAGKNSKLSEAAPMLEKLVAEIQLYRSELKSKGYSLA